VLQARGHSFEDTAGGFLMFGRERSMEEYERTDCLLRRTMTRQLSGN
jgi:hypothetical protein